MDLEQNKVNAQAFYQMAFDGYPSRAVEEYVGEEYIQHNPAVANGKQGFIDYFTKMYEAYPEKTVQFMRVIAEDNLVALHTRQVWPGNEIWATMDFFRFDDAGKICEHWDCIQQAPEKMAHDNGMF